MSLQFCPLAKRQRRAAVEKCIDFLVGAHESPFAGGFGYTSHDHAPVVKHKVSNRGSGSRGNPHGDANRQAMMNVACSKPPF